MSIINDCLKNIRKLRLVQKIQLIVLVIISSCYVVSCGSKPQETQQVLNTPSVSKKENETMDLQKKAKEPIADVKEKNIGEYEEVERIVVEEKPYSLLPLIPERKDYIKVFRPDTTLYSYCFLTALNEDMKDSLKEEKSYAYEYFDAITLEEIITGEYRYSFGEWVENNYGNLSALDETELAKEQNFVQGFMLRLELEYAKGSFEIEGIVRPSPVQQGEKVVEEPTTENGVASTPTPSANVTQALPTISYEKNTACYADITYDGKQVSHLVTTTFPKENFYFDKGKEAHVQIGSMIEGPSVILYLSDRIEIGKTYTMEQDTGYSFVNADAVFNAGIAYGSMFGYISYDNHTIPNSLGNPLTEATVCITKWDREEGIIEGTVTLKTRIEKVYQATFKDNYLLSDHPTRNEEYLAYLNESAASEGKQVLPDNMEVPSIEGLMPTEIPCHYCSMGKETCTMCVNGTTLRWKADSYGGEGCYVEESCKKCGGVGWIKCGVCYGDGTITMIGY
ncbi:hypothetical protein CS063_07390 [Sporanaerobium hydrogeniformans]|uniref:Uncharacterized protein n=1 Tax=Sporanaerobium hydrogeniformans TaxID=3072179 RepID=A0AC61DD32_9FIRM|nr:hypothetical protein [Sporanaerobium hydrogeniformans]PHV71145.1 hypothetical protein CS063_07390 [Sporanaerobium hydrogeniformans]